MNNPFCYYVYLDYEEYKIASTLRRALEILQDKGFYPDYFFHRGSLSIKAHFDDESIKSIKSAPFMEKVELSKEDLLKIEQDIEEEIKKTEERIKAIKFTCTGSFGITRDRKQWAIENEIKHRSYKWKDLDSIDWDNLEDIYID